MIRFIHHLILLIVVLSMLPACSSWYVRYPTAREVYGEPKGLAPNHVYIPLGYGQSYGSTIITTHPTTIIVR